MASSIIEKYLHLIIILFLLACTGILVVLLHALTGNFLLALSLSILISSFVTTYIVSQDTIGVLAFAFLLAFVLLFILFRNAIFSLFISSVIVSILVFLEVFAY